MQDWHCRVTMLQMQHLLDDARVVPAHFKSCIVLLVASLLHCSISHLSDLVIRHLGEVLVV